jgi:hypothetical protein
MCWFIEITAYGLDEGKAETIAADIRDKGGLYIRGFSEKDSTKGMKSTFAILDDTGHCACGLVGGEEDPNATTWNVEERFCERFVLTLERLFNEIGPGFYVEVIWGEEYSKQEKTISFKNLIELVKNQKIVANAKFRVD